MQYQFKTETRTPFCLRLSLSKSKNFRKSFCKSLLM